MSYLTRLIVILPALMIASALAQNPDSYIFPDPSKDITIVAADGSAGETASGRALPGDDPLAKMILNELRLPFHHSVIKVTQCLRNFVGDSIGPNVLFLSSDEGGFPRKGITIAQNGTSSTFTKLRFVDLVIDKDRAADGALQIYSHELGHVMMAYILPDFPDGYTNKQHVSMGVTDYATAFTEGWGEHFQRLAYDNIDLYRSQIGRQYHYTRATGRLWHSQMDQEFRLGGVVQNEYIYRKHLPQFDTTGLTAIDLVIADYTSPVFDHCKLKSGQEMLACEGVLSTLFYRIDTDSMLQNHYLDAAFYRPFLLRAAPDAMKPQDLFTPLENVLLKNAYVWNRIKSRLTKDSNFMIELVKEWATAFPEEKETILKIFVLTTVGKTVTNDLGAAFEKMAYTGMIGDIAKYRQSASTFVDIWGRVKAGVLSGQLALDGNVGPQLWLENKNCLFPRSLFMPGETAPLMVDLNTASVYELAGFSGMTLARATQMIQARDKQGYFSSMADAEKCGFVR